MKRRISHFIWPVIGLAAVVFSVWLLVHELRALSFAEVVQSLAAIPAHRWLLICGGTVLAYVALAEYDRIALLHLRRKIAWPYVALTSFTTYALAHNIGASVFSGAVVRYRAYSAKGLGTGEIGTLVALCSFTFALGTIILGGLVFTTHPKLLERFFDLPDGAIIAAGIAMLLIVLFYVAGSLLGFRPLSIGSFRIYYPRPAIVARQLIIGPLELIGAAAIIYFALPAAGNPGFVVILGVFLVSFSAALISHAPGGLGVLEFIFLTVLDEMDPADVLAALIIFRLFYLLAPLALALIVVLVFERRQMGRTETSPQQP